MHNQKEQGVATEVGNSVAYVLGGREVCPADDKDYIFSPDEK
jgi:hypothetical protein